MIKVATVCSGIGSPEVAIEELNVEHEIVFACDIDKYARASYLANFTPGEMYTDMTKESWQGEKYKSDLFMGGIPCQAFSLAGKRLGELDKRGLLFYDFYRYVQNQQPKVFIIENVKGLLSDAGGKTFQNWLLLLGDSVNGHHQMFNHPDSLGYNLHWTVLNSKDFGVPQNRERVFIVGVRNDLPNPFLFPAGERLTLRLKDILEPIVDEKYYLSDKMIENLIKKSDGNQIGFINQDTQASKVFNTLCAGTHGYANGYIEEPNLNQVGSLYDNCADDGRIYDSNGIARTIKSEGGGGGAKTGLYLVKESTNDPVLNEPTILQTNLSGQIYENHYAGTLRAGASSNYQLVKETKQRIRKLTPLECWRLQGFPDDNFYKAQNVPTSDTQLYKQAGNSMTSKVMKAIIKNTLPILNL